MQATRFCIYSILLGIGSALIGFVVGFLIKSPSPETTAIMIVIEPLFVVGTVFLARRYRKYGVSME